VLQDECVWDRVVNIWELMLHVMVYENLEFNYKVEYVFSLLHFYVKKIPEFEDIILWPNCSAHKLE
jgi:hypothetical protein